MSSRFVVSLALALLPGAAFAEGAAALQRLPLRFEANAGQWNSAVRYSARTPGYQLFLTGRQAVMTRQGQTLGLTFEHGNRAPGVEAEGALTPVNYLVGARSQWRSNVAQFSRVRYREVYPGTDLIFYGNGNEAEYDFVLKPNANPSRIRMKFYGADRIALSDRGDLKMTSGSVEFVQRRPVIYQVDATGARHTVQGRYKMLARNVVGLELDSWDPSRELTIDPVISYSSLLGGAGSDAINAVQVRNGRIYVAGYLNNNDVTGTDDAFRASSSGVTDGFLAILDPSLGGNSLVYLSYIGGSGNDVINSMALDAAGNVYLAGWTASTDFPLGGVNVVASFAGGDSDGFLVKVSPAAGGAASLAYGTYLGGSATDVANAVAVDSAGFVYVAGTTQSDNFPLSSGAYANALYGKQDAFLCKINPDSGTPLAYSTYFGGELGDTGTALAAAGNGIVYLAGATISSQLPQAGSMYRDTLAGAEDIYLAKFDTTKNVYDSLLYSTYIGGFGSEEPNGIALDSRGRVVMTGFTLSTDFPLAGAPYSIRPNGASAEAFVLLFDTTLRGQQGLVYSTYFGGSGGEVANAVAVDSTGGVWITGYTLSTDLPVTGNPLQSANPGGIEVFLSRFDLTQPGAAGLTFSTYIGNTGVHVGEALAIGPDGTVYVGGYTGPNNVKATSGAYQASYGGGLSDGFVAAIKP